MTGIRSLAGSGLQHSPREYAALVEKQKPELLELRTGAGAVYLLPSRWERMRLQWAFRHFHVLCPELLSRGDRRLVEKLWRSGGVKPSWPVPRDRVFGVIERALPAAAKNPRGIFAAEAWPEVSSETGRDEPRRDGLAESSPWRSTAEGLAALRGLAVWVRHSREFQRWKGLAFLSAVCLVVVVAKICGVPLNLSGAQPSSSPVVPAAPATVLFAAPVSVPATASVAARGATTVAATAPERGALARAALPAGNASYQNAAPEDSAQSHSVSGDALAKNPAPNNPGVRALAGGVPTVVAAAAGATALPLAGQPSLHPMLGGQGGSSTPASTATPPAAQPALPVLQVSTPFPAAVVAPASAAAASPAVKDTDPDPGPATAAARPLIFELPQGHPSYPVVPDSNFVGTVTLRAVIGTDGQVERVSVLSGDPKVAEAAVAAVKQWRYAPDEVGGRTVEAETNIGISFFGRDAISVTSPHSSGSR